MPSSNNNNKDLQLQGSSSSRAVKQFPEQIVYLESSNFSQNLLSGSIPPSIFSLKMLQILDPHENSLNQSIPLNLTQLMALHIVSLSSNQFSGSIPTGIGDTVNLTFVSLDRNQSSGSVSAEFGLLSKLNILSLALNNRIGQIPGNLSLCYELQVLNLQRNQLSDTIPSSFGSPASSISGLEWEPTVGKPPRWARKLCKFANAGSQQPIFDRKHSLFIHLTQQSAEFLSCKQLSDRWNSCRICYFCRPGSFLCQWKCPQRHHSCRSGCPLKVIFSISL